MPEEEKESRKRKADEVAASSSKKQSSSQSSMLSFLIKRAPVMPPAQAHDHQPPPAPLATSNQALAISETSHAWRDPPLNPATHASNALLSPPAREAPRSFATPQQLGKCKGFWPDVGGPMGSHWPWTYHGSIRLRCGFDARLDGAVFADTCHGKEKALGALICGPCSNLVTNKILKSIIERAVDTSLPQSHSQNQYLTASQMQVRCEMRRDERRELRFQNLNQRRKVSSHTPI